MCKQIKIFEPAVCATGAFSQPRRLSSNACHPTSISIQLQTRKPMFTMCHINRSLNKKFLSYFLKSGLSFCNTLSSLRSPMHRGFRSFQSDFPFGIVTLNSHDIFECHMVRNLSSSSEQRELKTPPSRGSDLTQVRDFHSSLLHLA